MNLRKGLTLVGILSLVLCVGCEKNNPSTPIDEKYNAAQVYKDSETTFKDLYNQAKKSVVEVKTSYSNKLPIIGTGVIQKEQDNQVYVLTNAHVLESDTDTYSCDNNLNITLKFHTGVTTSASCAAIMVNEDVALLTFSKTGYEKNYEVAKIVSQDIDVDIGDSVFAIGSPNGNSFSVTEGKITNNRIETTTTTGNGNTTMVYDSTAPINPGNSGGPLFNSNGEVIAINTMKPKDSVELVNFSIPINYFTKVAYYALANPSKTTYAKPNLPFRVKALSDYYVSELHNLKKSSVANVGLYVLSGIPEKYSGDILEGTVITQINNVDVKDSKDLKFILNSCEIGQTVTLTIIKPHVINAANAEPVAIELTR